LQQVISGSEIRYNAELPGSADAVVRTVKEAGLEGVVAKRRDSIYRGSTRSTDWLKLKLEQSQEFVIAGYNPNAGSFQSILAGYYERDKLMFAGKVRQGFNPASRAALFNKMKRLVTARSSPKSGSPNGHPMACSVMPPLPGCAMTKNLPR
jgi:ATP-dependent DNA ligase